MAPIKAQRYCNALCSAAAVTGFALAVEGLALINVSIASMSSAGSFTMVLTGLQTFCLGGLAISAVIVTDDQPRWLEGARGYLIMLFLLLIFPAALFLA